MKIDKSGSSLKGYVETTYKDIVNRLGKPNVPKSVDGKTNAEWCFAIDDEIVTIYDYKTIGAPKGLYDWHIGGFSKKALKIVERLNIGAVRSW